MYGKNSGRSGRDKKNGNFVKNMIELMNASSFQELVEKNEKSCQSTSRAGKTRR